MNSLGIGVHLSLIFTLNHQLIWLGSIDNGGKPTTFNKSGPESEKHTSVKINFLFQYIKPMQIR